MWINKFANANCVRKNMEVNLSTSLISYHNNFILSTSLHMRTQFIFYFFYDVIFSIFSSTAYAPLAKCPPLTLYLLVQRLRALFSPNVHRLRSTSRPTLTRYILSERPPLTFHFSPNVQRLRYTSR